MEPTEGLQQKVAFTNVKKTSYNRA